MLDAGMDAIEPNGWARDIEDMTRQAEVALMELDAEARGVLPPCEGGIRGGAPYWRAGKALDVLEFTSLFLGGGIEGGPDVAPFTVNSRYEAERDD